MQFYKGYGNQYHPMVDYFNAMEPETYSSGAPSDTNLPELGIKDIGMSVPMGIAASNVAGIYSKIRMGAGAIEIQFPGTFRGQRQAHTPGMYGEEQRQAIRELGAINEVKFTTHASFGIMGLSGYTGDNPYNVWFQREVRRQTLEEVKRAIDFARDTAGGGAVVVQTGEVDRPISEQPWARDQYGRLIFKQYEEEPEVARIRVVDERTGQVMEQVRKNRRVSRPDWLRAEEDKWGVDINGNKLFIRGKKFDSRGNLIYGGDYVDYFGKKIPDEDIYDHERGRVPKYDPETGRFKNRLYNWEDMIKEANERNAWKARMLGKRVEDLSEEERILPEEVHLRSTLEVNEGHSRGWSMQYGIDTERHLDSIKKIKKALEFYELLEQDIPEDEKWRIKRQVHAMLRGGGAELIPPDSKNPTEILKKALVEEERALLFSRQSSDSQLMQAEDSYETQQYIVSADKYAIREAVKSYADAGIHAMDASVNPKNPVVITLENIFPERFGGHPQELKRLIKDAREEMVARLSHKQIRDPAGSKVTIEEARALGNIAFAGTIKYVDNPYFRGLSEEEARMSAERHIKATFDTGHLNMWRKYWQDNPMKSKKDNDDAFKTWMLKNVEELAKEKLIGNVHLTDNYGYQDEHLSPGQGSTPIREIVNILRRYGYNNAFTVEPGADASVDNSDFHGLMKTWRYFNSPIYGFGVRIGAPQTWSEVHYSYFGQDKPPYFIFGGYSPSNEWTLWSGMPME